MSLIHLLTASLLTLPALSNPVLLPRQTPTYVFPGDAPFTVDPALLSAALTCPNGNPSSGSPPVLLVHGTASTGSETWGDGYVPALLANGYTACYVDLPNRAMGDMQISSEYIAYSLHALSSLSGGLQPAIIAHSQGNPDVQWALRFWPSARGVTRAFVALAPDFGGIELLSSNLSHFCTGNELCQASIWQQSLGSEYYAALHGDGDFRALVPTTAIYTEFDEVVVPAEGNARLPDAAVVAVQDLCPARLVDHLLMTVDAAGFALALDALDNGGIADLDRVRPHFFSICFRIAAPKMKLSLVANLAALWGAAFDGFLLGMPRVSVEPPVMPYALLTNFNGTKIRSISRSSKRVI